MKPKQIVKIMLDILMLILFISLICFSATGIVFHEVSGLVLLFIIIAHLMLNRRWIIGVSRQIFSGKVNQKAKVNYTVNCLLLLSITITFLTGFCISQVIFPINIGTSSLAAVHKWMSYVCLGVCTVHAALHLQYIKNFIKKLRSERVVKKVWATAYSLGAAVAVSGIIYSQCVVSFKNSQDSGNNILYVPPTTSQSIIYEESIEKIEDTEEIDNAEEKTAVISQDVQEIAESVTLQEFLGKMYCTACPKHCSLLAPRCGRGQNQVQQAKAEYQELYSVN